VIALEFLSFILMRNFSATSLSLCLLSTLGALLVASCASTKIPAQWSDPAFANQALRGAKVLVVCEAEEPAIQRICQDEVAARMSATGVVPVTVSPLQEPVSGRPDGAFGAAREMDAKAVFVAKVTREASVIGSSARIGVGVGTSVGWGSGTVVGGGVGSSAPIGSTRVDNAYGASMVLTDIATGRMMWTMKATTPASQNVDAQIRELAKVGVEEAQKAGML